MPTPGTVHSSPLLPRAAQPPYTHVDNSTRAELHRLGVRALRATVDVEHYCSSYLDGDPAYDQPPSLLSASPSEDSHSEDPKNPSGRKKKRERKRWRQERCHCKEAKAIATSKIVAHLPGFTRKDLSGFAEIVGRLLRMTGETPLVGRWSATCSCSVAGPSTWRRR